MKSKETQKASMELIITACNQIQKHVFNIRKEDYDWKREVYDALEVITTEANSWLK